MTGIYQALQLLRISLLSLPARLGPSLVIVIGMAGTVAVVIAIIAVALTFDHTIRSSGHEDRAIVLRKGSVGESTSVIPRETLTRIADAPGVGGSGPAGAFVSGEILDAITLHLRADDTEASGQLRGVGPAATLIRPELHMVEGRYFRPGSFEAVVGKTAKRKYREMDLGQKVKAENADWTVVGVFETGGDLRESFTLVDVDTLMSTSHRDSYTSVTALLKSPGAFQEFREALTSDPAVAVDVYRESDYYFQQARGARRLFLVLMYGIGGIMAIGALFAAANTMIAAVAVRTREIATLRAVGFGSMPTVLAMLGEVALLAIIGALLGATLAWIFFGGKEFGSSVGNSLTSQLIFELNIGPWYFAAGAALASVLGLAGGLLPAVRAAMCPVATALRKT
ncbi:MAG TPA: ABC transporter permease [Steroidobacteraceae bacterium]